MIDRYTRPEMGHIFSLENKYAIWQEIEVLACEARRSSARSAFLKTKPSGSATTPTLRRQRSTRSRKSRATTLLLS